MAPVTVSDSAGPVPVVETEPTTARASIDIAPIDTFEVPPAEVPPADLWERIRDGLSWQSIDNSTVDKARQRFLGQSDYLPVVAERGAFYLYYIVEALEVE